MRYQNIFRQSYNLTVHNPLLWLFGLVMLGGFNLSLINFSALVPNNALKTWPIPMSVFSGLAVRDIALFAAGLLVSFLIIHFIKIAFIIIVHNLIHDAKKNTCRLCVHLEQRTAPYLLWWLRSIAASLITIAFTTVISVAVNALINQAGRGSIGAIVLNIAFLVIVTCVIGTWNVFASYFVVLHDFNFHSAIRSAFDLLILQFQTVFEFIVLLSAIYTLAVIVGNAFINGWQHGFGHSGLFDARAVFLGAFLIWFAINNAFFNTAFFIFFEQLVKATPAAEKQPLPSAV